MSPVNFVLISLFFWLAPFFLFAQQWVAAETISSPAKEAVNGLATDSRGNVYLSGIFGDQLTIGNETLQSIGLDDVFLTKYRADGSSAWTVSGGGTNFDQTSDLAITADDHIIWGGQFWVEGQFDSLTLPLVHNSRGIFLLKYDAEGQLIWGRSIEGEGLKILSAIDSDLTGNIYLTGYFENTLILADTTLEAAGSQSLFLLKLTPTGQFIWAKTAGYDGEIRPKTIVLNNNGALILAGDLMGKAVFGSDSIQSNTQDRDVFIASYDTSGQALWGRKAGGVYEDNCNALVIDEADNSYLTGTFLGVMSLGPGFEIMTDGFNENFFLAAYRANGTPFLARSLGSTADEAGHDILLHRDQILITGNYYGQLRVDGMTLSGDEDHFNAFVAAFDLDGKAEWLHACKSNEYIEGNFLAARGEAVFLAGNFGTDAILDALRIEGEGFNDVFLAELKLVPTSISDPISQANESSDLLIFPNPGSGTITFSWENALTENGLQLQLINLAGQVVEKMPIAPAAQSVSWQANDFPAGIYLARLTLNGQLFKQGKVVVLD